MSDKTYRIRELEFVEVSPGVFHANSVLGGYTIKDPRHATSEIWHVRDYNLRLCEKAESYEEAKDKANRHHCERLAAGV